MISELVTLIKEKLMEISLYGESLVYLLFILGSLFIFWRNAQ